jgi:hypothetical protein
VTRGEIPADVRRDALLWAGCIAGALDENLYREKLAAAGFDEISVEPTRIHKVEVIGTLMSAFVRARKP